MKASSVIGLVVAIAGLYLGATLEGSNPMAVLSPSAMLIVLGGTLGAVIIGTSFAAITNIPKMYMKAFNPTRPTSTRRSPSSSATPRPRVVTACWPSTRSPRRSRTRTPEGPAARRRRHRPRPRRRHPRVRERRHAQAPRGGRAAVRQGRRLRPDDGHHRHRLRPDPRARQPRQARDARPVDLRRVRRDAARRRLGQRHLPPDRRPPEAALPGGAPRPRADRRGHPLHPGRRQPARRPGEAHHLRPAGAARRRDERRRGRRRRRRRPRKPSWPVTSDTRGRTPRGGARERGALARVLRGHDDAPVLPLHGALLDLVGEHVEVRGAPEVAQGRVLGRGPRRRQVDA